MPPSVQDDARDALAWLDEQRPVKRAMIAALLASYPSARVVDPRATIEAYVDALEVLDLPVLRRAIDRARLTAANPAFAASAAEILQAAARIEEHEVGYHPWVEPAVRARDATQRARDQLLRRRVELAEARALAAGERVGRVGGGWQQLDALAKRMSAPQESAEAKQERLQKDKKQLLREGSG